MCPPKFEGKGRCPPGVFSFAPSPRTFWLEGRLGGSEWGACVASRGRSKRRPYRRFFFDGFAGWRDRAREGLLRTPALSRDRTPFYQLERSRLGGSIWGACVASKGRSKRRPYGRFFDGLLAGGIVRGKGCLEGWRFRETEARSISWNVFDWADRSGARAWLRRGAASGAPTGNSPRGFLLGLARAWPLRMSALSRESAVGP